MPADRNTFNDDILHRASKGGEERSAKSTDTVRHLGAGVDIGFKRTVEGSDACRAAADVLCNDVVSVGVGDICKR